MTERLPIHKYTKVWIKSGKNNPKNDGTRSTSYTLDWVEFGRRRFLSLGRHATLAYAKQAAAVKEQELNSFERYESLDPITWSEFTAKFLDTFYPGHDQPPEERRKTETGWSKSRSTMRRERHAMVNFVRLVQPHWCHEINSEDRERFVNARLGEVGSAESVNIELRTLRLLCNVMEEWKHRPANSNPFARRRKASVAIKQNRNKQRESDGNANTKYFTIDQIARLLEQADKEVKDNPDDINKHRMRALVYFEAYTGARINEALHLEWQDIDFEKGIAWLYFKFENDLKTESSAAPFGLPNVLLDVLTEWKQYRNCNWVFPNSKGKPWVSGGPGYKPLDQLKKLAKRAGIDHTTWKMFRHSFNTHGKGRFGITTEQMRAHLRHSSQETQKHYYHMDLENLRAPVKHIDFRSP